MPCHALPREGARPQCTAAPFLPRTSHHNRSPHTPPAHFVICPQMEEVDEQEQAGICPAAAAAPPAGPQDEEQCDEAADEQLLTQLSRAASIGWGWSVPAAAVADSGAQGSCSPWVGSLTSPLARRGLLATPSRGSPCLMPLQPDEPPPARRQPGARPANWQASSVAAAWAQHWRLLLGDLQLLLSRSAAGLLPPLASASPAACMRQAAAALSVAWAEAASEQADPDSGLARVTALVAIGAASSPLAPAMPALAAAALPLAPGAALVAEQEAVHAVLGCVMRFFAHNGMWCCISFLLAECSRSGLMLRRTPPLLALFAPPVRDAQWSHGSHCCSPRAAAGSDSTATSLALPAVLLPQQPNSGADEGSGSESHWPDSDEELEHTPHLAGAAVAAAGSPYCEMGAAAGGAAVAAPPAMQLRAAAPVPALAKSSVACLAAALICLLTCVWLLLSLPLLPAQPAFALLSSGGSRLPVLAMAVAVAALVLVTAVQRRQRPSCRLWACF